MAKPVPSLGNAFANFLRREAANEEVANDNEENVKPSLSNAFVNFLRREAANEQEANSIEERRSVRFNNVSRVRPFHYENAPGVFLNEETTVNTSRINKNTRSKLPKTKNSRKTIAYSTEILNNSLPPEEHPKKVSNENIPPTGVYKDFLDLESALMGIGFNRVSAREKALKLLIRNINRKVNQNRERQLMNRLNYVPPSPPPPERGRRFSPRLPPAPLPESKGLFETVCDELGKCFTRFRAHTAKKKQYRRNINGKRKTRKNN